MCTVRAVVQDRYGSPDALEVREIERPDPGARQVLVRVEAACLDRGELHLMTGLPYMLRVMGFGLLRPKLRVRGTDVAGIVEAVGSDVSGLRPGDPVFGFCEGALAEYALADGDKLVGMPEGLGYEQAAALPASATAALQFVRDFGRVARGQKVLVIGAGGGVGTFAVQMAAARGAEVTGVCSAAKDQLVRSIGATHVIDYEKEDFVAGKTRYDVIIDTAGNRRLSDLRHVLTREGVLLIAGGEGGRWVGGTQRNLRAYLISPYVRQTLLAPFLKGRREHLEAVRELVEAGEVRPIIDRSYPLDKAAEAFRYLAEGHPAGKITILVSEGAGG